MPTWSELRADFDGLNDALRFHRLEFQWGSAGTYYHMSGGGTSHATRKFEALASIAGDKLLSLRSGQLKAEVLATTVSNERWYEALRHHSGAFEHGIYGWQSDEDGNHAGNIYTGSVPQPSEASAVLALRLSGMDDARATAVVENSWVHRVERLLKNEAEKRGYLWLTVAFVVTAALGLMAL